MTFAEWLNSQQERKDAIGDLARATAGDQHAPRGKPGWRIGGSTSKTNAPARPRFARWKRHGASTASCTNPEARPPR
jgi:hypothetical protein